MPTVVLGSSGNIGHSAAQDGVTVVLDRLIIASTLAGAFSVANGDAGGTLLQFAIPANETIDVRNLKIQAIEGDWMSYLNDGAGTNTGIAYYHLVRRLGTSL